MKDIKNPAASGDTQLSSILLLKCLQNLIHLACHLISPWKPRFFSLLHSNCVRPPAFGDEVGYFLQMTESLVYAHRVGWGFKLCFICLFYFYFFFGSKQLSFSLLKKSLHGFPHAEELLLNVQGKSASCRACRHTSTCARRHDGRERTDRRTDGKHSGTHPHGSAGAKGSVHGGAGTPRQRLRVCARAAGALAQQAKARARLPARLSGVGTLTTGNGLGGRGRVKPARGRGGTLVPTLLIERDSCLRRRTTAKETAFGENNNNKKKPQPSEQQIHPTLVTS